MLPDNVETPNTVSAVLRLPSGLTFEPRVILQSTSKTTDPGIPNVPSTTDKTSDLQVALLVRYPIVHHGRFELELLGAAGISQHKVNPDGPDNDTTTNTQSLDWGVGIGYWFSRHWALSVEALNPLLSHTSTESPNGLGMGMNQTNTTTTYGIVFDPTIAFLIHLYH